MTISDKPEHPFKLATFEAGGQVRVGMVLGTRVLDIAGANLHVERQAALAQTAMPNEMRALIEQYDTLAPRLYQIANYEVEGIGTLTTPFKALSEKPAS